MPNIDLWAGALSLVLRHDLTGCAVSAHQAADLLARIADNPDVDHATRTLCDEASLRLIDLHTEEARCRPCRPCQPCQH